MGISENQIKTGKTEQFSITETGESSSATVQTCDICVQSKSKEEFFKNPNCSHMFCSDCISKHVASKIQENITMVKCPYVSCQSLLEPEHCHSVLPSLVFDRWVDALSEIAILGLQKFQCPFRDCSAILIDERDEGGWNIRESECPCCNRLFCANCKVPWHSDFECQKFQELNRDDERRRDDLQFMKLARSKSWQTCQRCKFYVERTQGCSHITCRCGFEFCYSCGSGWTSTHKCCRE